MAKKSGEFDFEKALADLEALVEKMEQGELSLEESIKSFERGIALTRACQKALAEAEQKVQILMDQGGRQELAPFSGTDSSADDDA
jgi:exodeoxyribonuclease VII small subunit